MKVFYSALCTIMLFLCQAITVIASPAYPYLIQMKQPDGSSVSVYLKGDEKIHRMESEDGYSLLYDNNRTIVYAIAGEKGDMIPSSVSARNVSLRSASDQSFLKGIPKQLNYSATQINTLRSIWEISQNASKPASSPLRAAVGEAHAVCALIGFPDKPLTKTKAEFNNLMNQAGYSANGAMGSVNDYYKENSYGKLNLVITVAGPYTVSKNWSYYGENGSDGSDMPDRVQEFAMEAARLTFSDPTIHPADYDNDNDGYIDAFHIIYAGYGEESGGDPNCIWAHEYGFSPLTFAGKKLSTYSCSPELQGNSGKNITNIGVICHEMCHIFGSPDFYDVDGDSSGGNFPGTGKWDLMGSGSWNDNGACPAHINMYQKIKFGWVNPTILSQPQIVSGVLNSAMNPVAYRYNTVTPNEYFVLENRQKTGFDRYVPGTGLLIYRVSITNSDISNNTVNTGHPQKVYPVCASANTNPNQSPISYGSTNSAGCPFPGTSQKTSFTDYTIPSATSWSGANTTQPLTEIQEQNGAVSFRFSMPDAEPVTNFQASVENQTSVKLSWNKPSEDVIGYNIYRNNLLLIKLIGKNNISYTQNNVNSGSYTYCVTALYTNKESSPICKEIQINNSSSNANFLTIKNLTAQNINGNKDIELSWQSPFVSDWVTHTDNYTHALYYNTTQFTSAARFTTDDLQNFYGSKLTKVRFAVNSTKCKYTIQVWLTDAENNGNINVPNTAVATKTVVNPSPGINDITLDSPIVLENNKELWIGIQYQMTPMNDYVAVFENTPSLTMRNWVYTDSDGWGYIAEEDSINWFISGYLQFDNTFLQAPENTWLRSENATIAAATNYVIYRDNDKIALTTLPTYVDPQPEYGPHIYCVTIAYNDGNESEPVCVEAVSSFETSLESIDNSDRDINIYPNPVKKGEILVIQCKPIENSILSFFDISSKLIMQERITESVIHKKIDFEPGVYLLQIKNHSETITRKIIIK